MILSHGRSYLFIHIPKTGGTSLALALESRAMKDDMMLGDTPKARKRRGRLAEAQTRGRLWKHSTLADLDGLVSPADLEGLFVFTLVRNPWDRAVSYYYWLRTQNFAHPAVALAKELTFEAFVSHDQTRESFARHPARRYVTDATGQMRGRLFIRLESFDEDAGPLWDHLGFSLSLGHENASARQKDYRPYYSAHARAAVAEACAEDIERFGYSFG